MNTDDFPHDFPVEMISQPLTTSEGFVNPAAINELNAAIAAIPPTHVRLAGDGEWSNKRLTSRKEIVGAFARWACEQSPYGVPDGIENVSKYLHACLGTEVAWDVHGFANLSLCDVNRILHEILMSGGVKEFESWNRCKRGDTRDVAFVSAVDGQRDPDRDFIDLSALLHNVCLQIRTSRREFDRFNEEFDRRHKTEK